MKILDFVMGSSASPKLAPGMTGVVEINDKKSVEDGEVVWRRTIITLGSRVVAPSSGSSSSIKFTLLNDPVDSKQSAGYGETKLGRLGTTGRTRRILHDCRGHRFQRRVGPLNNEANHLPNRRLRLPSR